MAGTIPIQRILLLRPSALGDVCRTAPVLASLRARWPHAEIYWVVQSTFADAIAEHPALTGVIPFPRASFRGAWRRPAVWGQLLGWFRGLRRTPWDLTIDCQGLARTGCMMAASGARIRVCDRAAREGAWIPANRRVRLPAGDHEVDRMLHLAEAAGAPPVHDATLYVPKADQEWQSARWAEMPEGSYAVLAVTSRWESKAWPTDHWADLARQIVDRRLADWILLPGGPSERSAVAKAARAMRAVGVQAVDLSGQTSVGQLMAAIDSAAFTVSSDSAALHMALGLGARCLGLYGPTDPAIVGPWRRPDLAVRAPLNDGEQPYYRDPHLGDSIMKRLEVTQVVNRLDTLAATWQA